jgi:hypothetical protein
LKETLWDNPWFFVTPKQSSEPPANCPITGFPCEGDLSYLCEDYLSDGSEYYRRPHFRPRLDETRIAHAMCEATQTHRFRLGWL